MLFIPSSMIHMTIQSFTLRSKHRYLGPSQVAIYLELKFNCFDFNSKVGLAYPLEKRVEHWLSITKEFVTDQALTALPWLHLV